MRSPPPTPRRSCQPADERGIFPPSPTLPTRAHARTRTRAHARTHHDRADAPHVRTQPPLVTRMLCRGGVRCTLRQAMRTWRRYRSYWRRARTNTGETPTAISPWFLLSPPPPRLRGCARALLRLLLVRLLRHECRSLSHARQSEVSCAAFLAPRCSAAAVRLSCARLRTRLPTRLACVCGAQDKAMRNFDMDYPTLPLRCGAFRPGAYAPRACAPMHSGREGESEGGREEGRKGREEGERERWRERD